MATAKKGSTAKKTTSAKKPARRASTTKYVRNIRNVPVTVKFDKDSRRIELKPRGQRGDLTPLKKGELEEAKLHPDLDFVYEVITEKQAHDILSKQTTNQQARHPALSALRNEHGEEYTGVVMEEPFEKQGTTVARLENGEVVVDKIGIQRSNVAGTVDNPLPNETPEQTALRRSDEIARSKKVEGPEAGLGGFKVVE